jgi:hypothetical protein
MGPDAVICIPSFIKIGSGIKDTLSKAIKCERSLHNLSKFYKLRKRPLGCLAHYHDVFLYDQASSICLSPYRSIASSKLSSPKSAILSFLLQLPVSSCFLKVILYDAAIYIIP